MDAKNKLGGKKSDNLEMESIPYGYGLIENRRRRRRTRRRKISQLSICPPMACSGTPWADLKKRSERIFASLTKLENRAKGKWEVRL